MTSCAILGGRFDPPHVGHVGLARRALERFELVRLLVLVAADPGHKAAVAPPQARLELARLAFAEVPADVELDAHRYTVDLLESRALDDPLFLVGADELVDFPTWRRPERVLEIARLGVATRPGYPRERLEAALARVPARERVQLFELEPHDVSSSEIRARVAGGQSLDGLVAPAVAARIAELGLYRAG
ncbi:MAG TPA: nicotinate-nicotinamide nucleotide adenylyltransferase [Gaiellaceae bacterium]|nr:nicotinate-nicotinamide nucleotide adenylyltransferase [Gaiellaceae bacterium]